MDPRTIPQKMLYGVNQVQNEFDFMPLQAKLLEVVKLAQYYQTGTPAKINFAPLIAKIKDAAAIGAELQRKARSGNL